MKFIAVSLCLLVTGKTISFFLFCTVNTVRTILIAEYTEACENTTISIISSIVFKEMCYFTPTMCLALSGLPLPLGSIRGIDPEKRRRRSGRGKRGKGKRGQFEPNCEIQGTLMQLSLIHI